MTHDGVRTPTDGWRFLTRNGELLVAMNITTISITTVISPPSSEMTAKNTVTTARSQPTRTLATTSQVERV